MRFAARATAALFATLLSVIAALSGTAADADARRPMAFGVYTEGAPWQKPAMDRFTQLVGRRPVIWQTYRNWDQEAFPIGSLRNTEEEGALTLVTWEPWGHDLRSIASGRYDSYIRENARDAVAWGKPVLLRFAHEMNGDWYPWGRGHVSSGEYKAAWRHVVGIFRREGATNVRWIWSPNTGEFGSYFPGDGWTDFTGLDGYNWGAKWGRWDSFEAVFDSSYRSITRLSRKPLIITEFAANHRGGDKAAWIRHAFSRRVAERYPRIRALVWFDKSQDGGDWRVDSSSEVLRAFRDAVNKPLMLLTLGGLLTKDADEPEPTPADPAPAPPTAGVELSRKHRPRCGTRPGHVLGVSGVWTVNVRIWCGRRVKSCFGVVRVRSHGRRLGRARIELWSGRRQSVTVGLSGWAHSSLRRHPRLRTRVRMKILRGRCGAGAVHHVRMYR